MEPEIIHGILSEVQETMSTIFGDEMLFGFVCGGFSKGYADKNHDIDIFICLKNEPKKETVEKYLQWYFEIHKNYGVAPDYDYPGEIVTYSKLLETLKILESLKLTLKIDTVQTKKAIIWADMLTSKTAAEAGVALDLLHGLKIKYSRYPEKWKQEVLALIPKEERVRWKDKSHLLIMEHYMQYPKHDGKKLEKYYK